MEHRVLTFFSLVVGSQAWPIRNTCSTQCTGTYKFRYRPGRSYEFDYHVDTATAMQGASEGKSGLKMSAKVYMDIPSKCEMIIRVGSVTLYERDPESPENLTLSAASREFSKRLEEHHMRVSFQDGRIEAICPPEGEKTWVLNIKRGVLSMIQNTMNGLYADQKVKESDVAGICDTDYSVAENTWHSVTIKKHKNLIGCTQRNSYVSAIQGTPYNVPSEIQSLPMVRSSYECTQVIGKSSGILRGSTCKEEHTFRPFSRENSGARTESKQSLKYVRKRYYIRRAVPPGKRKDMNFEHDFNSIREMKTRKDIEMKLLDICQFTKDDVRPGTPRLFTDLVYLLRTIGTDTFEEIYQSVESGSLLCSDNYRKVRKFFLDAIPMVNTDASLKLMVKLISNGDITGIEADMWMTTLAFIQHPTKEMIKEVTPMFGKSGTSMLAVTSLLNRYCMTSPCDNDMDVNNLISILENKIGYGCYVDDNKIDNVVLTLRAFGNVGYISAALPTINSCITRKENPMEVRVAAVEAFRRASCEIERSEPLAVFKNKDEDSELRIAAYLSLMKCPSQTILGDVKAELENEKVNQVGSFIWSHLTNLMNTSSPLKQNISTTLGDYLSKTKFDLNTRMFSKNYERSLFWEKLNTGASVESNLIWSSKSFMPRSAMANLAVDVFGYSVNLFEIGGRFEGLEYFLESYFGPNGHFNESDIKEATKQAVKGIDKKKWNRINSQFGSEKDRLKGCLYMKIFGNELRYTSFRGLSRLLNEKNINIPDILNGLSKENVFTFTQNTLLLDSSMVFPTSAGFPLALTVNGSTTIDLKTSGKIDIRKLGSSPRSMTFISEIQPSAAVEISSMISVDAFVTKSGLKMVSTVHSSTLMKGKVELKDSQVFSAKWDMPKDKMKILSVKTSFFTVHQHIEKEQKMITDNRQKRRACSGSKLAKITGLEICGELQFPNPTMKFDAPYFPFTGPVVMDITLQKHDSHKSYNLDAKIIKNGKDMGMSIAFNTPASNVDRAFSVDIILKKYEQTFLMGFVSPWKKATVEGAIKNNQALKRVSGDISVDGKKLYQIVAETGISRNGNFYIYTPSVLLKTPKRQPIELKCVAEYQPAKLLDVELTFSGVLKNPIKAEADVTFSNDDTMRGSVQLTTPVSTLKDIGGSFSHKYSDGWLTSNARVSISGKSLSAYVFFNNKNGYEGSALLTGPLIPDINMKFRHKGDTSGAKTKAELKLNNKEQLGGQLEYTSSLRKSGSISVRVFDHQLDGAYSHEENSHNFKSHAEMNINGEKSSADVNVTFSNNDTMRGSVQLNTPVSTLKDIGGSFSHKYSDGSLTSNARVSISGKSLSGDVFFNNKNGYEGSASLTGPLIPDMNMKFRHKGDTRGAKTNAELKLNNKEQLGGQLEYTSGPRKNGSISVRVFDHQLDGAYSHEENSHDFKGHTEMNINGEKSSADVTFSNDDTMRGSVQLITPVSTLKDIGGSFSHKYSDGSLTSNARVSISGKSLSGDVFFNNTNGYEGSASLTGPLIPDMNMKFRHKGDTRGAKTNAELKLNNKEQLGGQLEYTSGPRKNGSISVRVFDHQLDGAYSHEEKSHDFKGHAEMNINGEKSSADVTFSNDDTMRGSVQLITPVSTLKDIGGSFSHKYSDGSLTSNARVSISGKSLSGDVFFNNTNGYEGSASLTGPLIPDMNMKFRHKGDTRGAKTNAELKLNNKEQLGGQLEYTSGPRKNGSISVRVFDHQLDGAYSHEENSHDFKGHTEMNINGEKSSADVTFSNDDTMRGSVQLITPVSTLKDIGGSFSHKYSDGSLTSNARVSISGKSLSGDVFFNNKNGYEGSASLTGALIPDMNMKFRHKGDTRGAKTNAELKLNNKEQLGGQLEYTSGPRKNGSISVRVFDHQLDGAYSHEEKSHDFKGHAEMNINGEKSSADVTFSNDDTMRGSVQLITPVSTLKDIGGSFSHKYSDGSLTSNARVSISGKTLSGDVFFNNKNCYKYNVLGGNRQKAKVKYGNNQEIHGDINLCKQNQFSGSAKLKTPFPGFEELSGSYNHKFRPSRLEVHAEIIYAEQQKVETDIEASLDSPYLGGVTLKTPFTGFEESKAVVELKIDRFGFSGKALCSCRQNFIEGSINYNKGHGYTFVSLKHGVSKNGFQNNVDMTVGQNKIQSTVNYNNVKRSHIP